VKLGELEEPTRSAAVAPVSPTSNSGSVNPTLGVSVQLVPAELAAQAKLLPAQRGVMVIDVVPLGPAYQKLATRDVIYELLYPGPRRPIRTPADLNQVLQRVKPGDYVSFNVTTLGQEGSNRVVNIRIGG
jgi:S1-C subfamily serine protease